MTSKRGTTLIETLIAIFILAVAIVALLEALNTGIFGTADVSRRTSGLNIDKSQIDFVKAQKYNASTGNISEVYGLFSDIWTFAGNENQIIVINGTAKDIRYGNDTAGKYAYQYNVQPSRIIGCNNTVFGDPALNYLKHCDVCDNLSYRISGQVANVSAGDSSLQKITVNVSYWTGKQVQLTSYRAAGEGLTDIAPRGMLVTDNIKNVPLFPAGYYNLDCTPTFTGYYHIFKTGVNGSISASWEFNWWRTKPGNESIGAPMMAIYEGIPNWVSLDYLGVPREDGIIYRQKDVGGIGDLPGPGTEVIIPSCRCFCASGCVGEDDPIEFTPHDPWFGKDLPCDGCDFLAGCYDKFYNYDYLIWPISAGDSGVTGDTITTDVVKPGYYTVLFFNAENIINLDTISASVTYWK